MTKNSFLFSVLLITTTSLFAQNKADDIVGYYLCTDPFSGELSQNYIYKVANGTYEGKVVWIKNEKLKNFEGMVFLTNLIFNAKENEWQNGTLIYPGKKGTYKTYVSLPSYNRLKLRGYWGVSLLGKTVYWTRENKKRED
jgi:uncharacterized protein (DUF2147 family)